jgi:hypothetical protein
MLREDRALARLAHPHIVSVYDSGTMPDGRPFLVLELIAGEPTSRLAPLPVGQALQIAEEVASALSYAHAQGIVHCDVTPQNVLLDTYGRAKLTDFGVASATAAAVGAMVYGSAPYLAPERLHGAPTSPSIDIYALGATLHFLLTGRPPQGEVAGAAPQPLGSEPTTPLPVSLPPAVTAILHRAMATDPLARYPSAAAFGEALAAAQGIRAPETKTAVLARTPVPARRVHTALLAALLGLLLFGVLGVAALARRGPEVPASGAAADSPPAATAVIAAPAPDAPAVVATASVVVDPPTPTAAAVPPVVSAPLTATPVPAPPVVIVPPTATPIPAPAVVQPQPAAPAPAPGHKEKDKKDNGKP